MVLFKKLFKKSEQGPKIPRGFSVLTVTSVEKITADTVKVELSVPVELKQSFHFVPGQYLNFCVTLDGKEYRRSYSICSGQNETLAVAVKHVENGVISNWFNNTVKAGDELLVAPPTGNFTRSEDAKNIVAIAAGSGITPILSIAKEIEAIGGMLRLYYGNKTIDSILFKNEIDELTTAKTTYYLSKEQEQGFGNGRIDKSSFTEEIKKQLDLLQSDEFFICGPEEMILETSETLKTFGVSDDKIRFELFTDPVLMRNGGATEEAETFEGTSNVSIILDDEKINFPLDADKFVLDAAIDEGADAPYSCKGGVCSTCKAKVLKGSAKMKINYSLTDSEVEEGYILTCQACPTSDELLISYDE